MDGVEGAKGGGRGARACGIKSKGLKRPGHCSKPKRAIPGFFGNRKISEVKSIFDSEQSKEQGANT